MVPRWRFLATFLRPVFSASRVQHVSEIRRGKKKKKRKKEEEETT